MTKVFLASTFEKCLSTTYEGKDYALGLEQLVQGRRVKAPLLDVSVLNLPWSVYT